MSDERKISPAFEQFMAQSRPHDKHEAIVIYRTTQEETKEERLNVLKEKLANVKAQAQNIKPTQAKFIADYKKDSSRHLPKSAAQKELNIVPVGANTLPVVKAQVTKGTLNALAQQQNVVAIMPNQKIHLIKPKEVKYEDLGKQENKDGITWGLKQLSIPDLWAKTKKKGKGVKVAVMDTGVHSEHPSLKNRVQKFIIVDSLGRRIETATPFDCGAHGTHVCGTIAGNNASGVSIGVAPEAHLLVAGVLIGDATLQTLIEGISWAVEKGADILSMSLGFTYYEPMFAEFFDLLINQYGVLPVAAIGNENHGNSSSPGNAHNALSIGAVEKMAGNKVEVCSFSSGASLTFPGAAQPRVDKPDIVAPGAQVYSCVPPDSQDEPNTYAYMDGTSMATPHVAGIAAILMAAKPQAPITEIAAALKETAKHPVGLSARPDNRWGYGIVQPLEAFNAL